MSSAIAFFSSSSRSIRSMRRRSCSAEMLSVMGIGLFENWGERGRLGHWAGALNHRYQAVLFSSVGWKGLTLATCLDGHPAVHDEIDLFQPRHVGNRIACHRDDVRHLARLD